MTGNLPILLYVLPALVVALTVHEFAHAWVASLLGDDYARRQGRVSLNPFRHLSLLGTLAIFVLRFGWGKPVPVNLYNFKNPKRDYLLCSLAGPAANILLLAVSLLVMLWTAQTYRFGPDGAVWMDLAHLLLYMLVAINAVLAVINLLPVPPLDGSKIWPCLIPKVKPSFSPRTRWLAVAVLIALVYTDSLDPLFQTTIRAVGRIVPVSASERFDEAYARGGELYEADKYAEAEQQFSMALDINPWSAVTFHFRAWARDEIGRWPEALADLDRAVELGDLDADANGIQQLREQILEHIRDAEAGNDGADGRDRVERHRPADPARAN